MIQSQNPMTIEMHAHSKSGSKCSNISMDSLISKYKELGVDTVCITERDVFPDPEEIQSISQKYQIKIFPGIEWSLEGGHF